MSPQTYFRIFKETIDGKEKFSLYQSEMVEKDIDLF